MESSPLHLPTPAQGSPKRRRHGQRSKVTRACDRCKSYARGKVPRIQAAEAEMGERDTSMLAPQPQYRLPTSTNTTASSTRHTPEPSSTMVDSQGHYIGPTSGVSFLLRMQKRLLEAVSFSFSLPHSTIFTFGDAPLKEPDMDVSFCMMLARADAQRLLDRYFDFAMPTYRFLHRPTIQSWFDEFYDTLGLMHDYDRDDVQRPRQNQKQKQKQSTPGKIALLFMVFAQGRVYMPDNDRPGPSDLSTRYYLAAEHYLAKERGAVRLNCVQSRLLQCYYLLTQSRINHCWSLFGTVSHLALAIGLNRDPRSNSSGMSQLEAENRRRTFWCLYTLDVYLSVALGRPRTFHDEDIDTEMPTCIDDDDLSDSVPVGSRRNAFQSLPSSSLIMTGSISHFKIAKIIGRIVRKLYPIRPISLVQRAALTAKISSELRVWRDSMSQFLDTDAFNTSLQLPIYQRQRNMLNLTYWHAVILTHRPYLLGQFTRQFSRRDTAADEAQDSSSRNNEEQDAQTAESTKQCLMAALKTVTTMEVIAETHQMFRSFWTTAYFAFTASIVLYIYVIQQRASPPEQYQECFVAATKCQKHLSGIAEPGSLPERYFLVLEELRLEAEKQTHQFSPAGARPPTGLNAEGHGDNADATLQGTHRLVPLAVIPPGHNNNSPTGVTANTTETTFTDCLENEAMYSQNYNMEEETTATATGMSDYESWEQFASIVSSGMNLDAFLNDSSFA